MVALLSAAIHDLVEQLGRELPVGLPILVAGPEKGRPGTPARFEEDLVRSVQAEGGWRFDERASAMILTGNTGGIRGLGHARALLQDSNVPGVLVTGVDSFLNRAALDHMESGRYLKTADNPDGVIPGEGAAALLVTRPWAWDRIPPLLEVVGLGSAGEEAAADSDLPNTGKGLAAAIRDALSDAGMSTGATDFRLSDVAGERVQFAETNYAMSRTLRERHEQYPLWLPGESLGEVGAAAGPTLLAVAGIAFAKGYAPGPAALCQTGSRSGARALAVVKRAG